MKALLIGGTGTISSAITTLAIARGWEIYLLNRGNKPLPEGARSIIADARDEQALRKAVSGRAFDVVVDFIAFTEEDVQRDFAVFQGMTGQFIFISSASAYQKPIALLPITESTPLANPYWQYSRDKIACEAYLMARYREDGFPVTIVRPSHTYCEDSVPVGLHGDNGSWQVLQRMREGKPVLIHGDGASLWTFTHNSDFAKGFVGLMGNPHALGENAHITSDESLSWNQAYSVIAQKLGVELRAFYMPSAYISQMGRAEGYDFEGGLLGDKSCTVLFDNAKIKRLVPGFCCTMRYDQGVELALEYILAHEECRPADPQFDAFCDRMYEIPQNAYRG